MKDRLWQAVYDVLRPLLNNADVVLAPRGDWPKLPCALLTYDDPIQIGDGTILVLHKGFLTHLPKPELRRIADQWQWIFANEVFIVLSRTEKIRKDIRRSADTAHCKPLTRFLHSAALRKRESKIVYVHVPKTGGTSMWASLTKHFPSHAYFGTIHAYLRNPPAPEDYDLIGLHFSPTVLLQSLSEDDWVIGMVRDPTERLFSAIMHARRAREDPHTFTASMKAMREMDAADYLATGLGRFEARLQLITFGVDHREPCRGISDEEMLHSALHFARRENVILAPTEHSQAFWNFLAKQLAFRPGALDYFNVNKPTMRATYSTEVRRAIGLINSINAREREFHDFVRRSFGERAGNAVARRRAFYGWPQQTSYAARAGQAGSL